MFHNLNTKIPDLIEKHQLWVRNTTPADNRKVLLLTVIGPSGRADSEPIPDTIHPIHLSSQIPKSSLANCNDIYKFVQSGAISVVEPKEASSYYEKNPMAMEAVKRAYSKVRNTSMPVTKESLVATDPNARPQEPGKKLTDTDVNAAIGTKFDDTGVNLMVRALVMNKAITPEDAALDLQNMTLTENDLVYVVDHAKGHLLETAKTMLANVRAN